MRFAFIFALLWLGWQAPAQASGDFGCDTSWKLTHGEMSDCDNMAIIGPGNDSRVNLMLLMADMKSAGDAPKLPADATPFVFFALSTLENLYLPQTDEAVEENADYSSGEGSRCLSNSSGSAAYEAALAASKVPAPERERLIAARRALQPDCTKEGALPTSMSEVASAMKSTDGKAYAAYLEGAAAFYAADYDAAKSRFQALTSARDSWLRETARYMLGRVEVNRAQLGRYDEYGWPKEDAAIDRQSLTAAEELLRAYMKAYPGGAYFMSARGLLRRVFWLARERGKLEAEYAALLGMSASARGVDDAMLAREIDSKLLAEAKPGELRDPTILAALDLMRMRVSDGKEYGDCCEPPISRSELEAQRLHFAANPALFDYLLATYAYYVEKKPAEALRLLPDASHQASFSYLQFSRQMLRGTLLDAKGDRNARAFWIDLLPGAVRPYQRPAVELALALHDERNQGLARVFEAGSPVRTPAIREILLLNVADAKLLRQQATAANVPAHERDVALFTLLYKQSTRGAHRDFVNDLALVPGDAPTDTGFYDPLVSEKLPTGVFVRSTALGNYGCPAFRQTQLALAANPANAKATLCVGEFMYENGFDEISLDSQPPVDQLGGTPTRFAGKPYSRLEAYKGIIASTTATAEDKAYALYRAVRCYAPSGSNSCGGPGVELPQRRAWFQRLKRDYPKSRWAQDLQYYW